MLKKPWLQKGKNNQPPLVNPLPVRFDNLWVEYILITEQSQF